MEIDIDEPTRPQIAAVLGISSRWVGELRSKGDLPADGASLLENIEAWAQAKYGVESAQGDLDFEAERARLTKEQADAKAMDNAERRRELASLPDMTGAVVSVIALAVTRLQQVGLSVANGDHKLRARIDTAINDALEELSVTRVEEARGGGLHEEEGPDEEET
ncbi:MAG TPA: terminase [Sphingomonas bacterium]|uniref:Terminase n=1 Tax=Sphingomonas bacterium TaxID=1895847 RepID=A0A3D0WBC6_9SPHN|nr:terminase [Sphingomonas bacterium]